MAEKTGDIASLSSTDLLVLALTHQLAAENQVAEDDWITPSNIEAIKSSSSVACMSSDLALQNVLLTAHLPIFAPDNKICLSRSKLFVLRCHACFKVTQAMDKKFCPACGNNTLTKTTASIDQDGNIQCYLKKNYVYNNRGTIYSIPKMVGGQQSADLILREDQKELLKAKKIKKKPVADLSDPDYVPSILRNLTLKDRMPTEIVIGYGKRNINQVKKTKK